MSIASGLETYAMQNQPTLTLIGAGPGAADLLTMRALRLLITADVVLYDALVGEEVLALIPKTARKIEVGKRGHRVSTAQSFINRLMVRLAKSGKDIVRLKGGDPSIFGRSSEEISFLQSAGIRVEIVPGITTASAAAAQFGFSLTKRGVAQRVLFATGRTAFGAQGQWEGAADPTTTLCLYMGCGDIGAIVQSLLDMGRAPQTPALVAFNVGRADAHLAKATLSSLADVVQQNSQDGPGLIIIGDVCIDAQQAARIVNERMSQLTQDAQVA
jgi:uroporphyrin-III C-methyltransferase